MPELRGIGVNVGSHSALAAFAGPGGGVETIRQDADADLTELREEAEVRVQDLVLSCVLALPVDVTPARRETLTHALTAAGLTEIRLVPEPEAAVVGRTGRFLLLDIGAGPAKLSVIDNQVKNPSESLMKSQSKGQLKSLMENPGDAPAARIEAHVEVEGVGGRAFDAALSEWLRERLPRETADRAATANLSANENANLFVNKTAGLPARAERIKIALSERETVELEDGITVERQDFERLTRFPLRRLAHVCRRLWNQYRPDRLLLTGGSSPIPLLGEILTQEVARPERLNPHAAVVGAALLARSASPLGDNGKRFRELRAAVVGLDLTRAQQDRLHLLFQRAEGAASDPEVIRLLEELVRDLTDIA